ncbi:MAG: AIR synthase family protein [Candidatus Aerophobetes bacterium]|nr:AIR synthase family protein [Candidatus Aerophobetes bacterium]
MNDKFLPVGKLDLQFLEELINSLPPDKRVIVGPGIGKDAAVIDFGKNYLVVKTDPITFTHHDIGWYVVNINANDIVCVGAIPRWFLLTLLLPEGKSSQVLVKDIFNQVKSACRRLNISLVGGHTEVTPHLDRPLAIGQMIGEVPEKRLIKNSGAIPGDLILVTKEIAIEGSHVIFRKRRKELEKKLPPEDLNRIKNILYTPGISIVKEALLASENVKIHCMHDPTEGGLKAGLWEIAYASQIGMRIKREKIPILRETETLCKMYGLDPLGLLASGSLILILPPKEGKKLLQIYSENNIKCSIIGKVVPKEKGVKIGEKKEEHYLLNERRDEINKIL